MPANRLDRLLQPSLARQELDVQPLYSVRANVIVAFIGGIFAAVILGIANSRRAGRMPREAWLYALGAIVGCAVAWWSGAMIPGELWQSWAGPIAATRSSRNWMRGIGIVFFGLVYLRHRKLFRAQEVMGVESPNPWGVSLAAVIGGSGLNWLFAYIGHLSR